MMSPSREDAVERLSAVRERAKELSTTTLSSARERAKELGEARLSVARERAGKSGAGARELLATFGSRALDLARERGRKLGAVLLARTAEGLEHAAEAAGLAARRLEPASDSQVTAEDIARAHPAHPRVTPPVQARRPTPPVVAPAASDTAEPPAAPAAAEQVDEGELAEILEQNVKGVVATLPKLSVEQLLRLAEMEEAAKSRKTVLTAIDKALEEHTG